MTNQNNDYTYWFICMALFNTSIGLGNVERNTEQQKIQQDIVAKLDLILEKLDER